MRTLQPRIWLAVVLLSAVALSVFMVVADRAATRTSVEMLSAHLAEAKVVETVVYEGNSYTVAEGHIDPAPHSLSKEHAVLRLAYAKRALRIDPPFALPGADLDAFARGIDQLAKVETDMHSLSEPFWTRTLAGYSTFPIGSLRAALEAETARREFLSLGTDTALAAYLSAAKRIPRNYIRDSIAFEIAYRYAAPDSVQYVTERHRVTKENGVATIHLLRARMRDANDSLEAFMSCLRSPHAFCDPEALRDPVTDSFDIPRPSSDPDHYALVRTLYASVESIETDDADVLLSESYCINPELSPLVVRSSDGRIREAGDMRFLRPAEFLEVPFFRYFVALGYTYMPSDPFSHYSCMVVPYDQGVAFAVYRTQEFAQTHDLAASAAGTLHGADIVRFEEEARTSDILDEAHARAYVRAAIVELASGAIPHVYEPELLELALMYDLRTAGAGAFVESVATSETRNVRELSEGADTSVSLDRVLFSRSAFTAFSMFLLPEVKPNELYEAFSLPRAETPYHYLTDLVPEKVSFEEIVNLMRRYHEDH